MIKQVKLLKIFNNNKKLIFDFSTLVSGAAISQLIPLVLQPLLRRLFTPEEFGIFAIYTSIFGIISIVACFRYEQAILIPKDTKEAKALFSLSSSLALITSIVLCLTLIGCFIGIPDFLSVPTEIKPFYLLLPFSAFFYATFQGLNSLMLREEMFRKTSRARIFRRVSEGITQISFGRILHQGGLILGDFIGNITLFSAGLFFLLNKGIKPFYFDWKLICVVAKKYIHFPKHNLIPHMLSTISTYMPFFFINKRFDTDLVGQFDLSNMVLTVPTALISMALSQLVFQRVAYSRQNHIKFTQDFRFIVILMCIIALFSIAVIELFAPFLFSLIFGKNWLEAGKIAQIVVFASMIRFVVSPLSVIFLALEKIAINSYWQIAHFIALVVVLSLKTESLNILLIQYVGVEIVSYLMYYILISREVEGYHRLLIEKS